MFGAPGQRINRRRPQGSPWIPHEPLCLVIFGGGYGNIRKQDETNDKFSKPIEG